MLKIENVDVMGWEAAIRGMRNPMNSWGKCDTTWRTKFCDGQTLITPYKYMSDSKLDIGPNDHDLMMRLRNSGTDHRKFMRMITVYLDITAPLYW